MRIRPLHFRSRGKTDNLKYIGTVDADALPTSQLSCEGSF